MGLCAACAVVSAAEPPAHVAVFDENNAMQLPADLDRWVFLGSSLGMGYSDVAFDPETPGNFHIATMEPTAYAAFQETGEFPDGAMFALSFYSAKTELPPNEAGFVMGELQLVEIHLKDRVRFPETGFNFYLFPAGETSAAAVPLPNDCVTCHQRDGAYDGVFTQFYPSARRRLSEPEGGSPGGE